MGGEPTLMSLEVWQWIAAAYLAGCFCVGYYWVRWRTGEDIRNWGSGNVGARNVGRRLGRGGFWIVLVGDTAKGALMVWLAIRFGCSREVLTGIVLAVIAGHNWPAQLKFRGGKGVAVSLGAMLVYQFWAVGIFVALLGPLWLLFRNVTVSGMVAYAVTPFFIFMVGLGPWEAFTASAVAVLVVAAHRDNLREELDRMMVSSTSRPKRNESGERTTL